AEHRALAVGSVNLFTGFEFNLADGEYVFSTFVEQLDDLDIKAIDRFAMFGDVHRQWPRTAFPSRKRTRLCLRGEHFAGLGAKMAGGRVWPSPGPPWAALSIEH